MDMALSIWRKFAGCIGGGLVVPALLCWTLESGAADNPGAPSSAVAPVKAVSLDLAAARNLALERQPTLTAYRASLEAAQVKSATLDRVGLAGLIVRDLRYRKQQSSLGIQIAEARVGLGEQETLYAVTRNYLTYLYAAQQEEFLDKTLVNVKDLKETVEQVVKDGTRKDLTTRDVDRIGVLVLLAEGRREEAIQGKDRAKAALREALGVGPDFPFQIAGKGLPDPKAVFTKDQVLKFAQSRRKELEQVADATEVFALEVRAQGATHSIKAPTFGSFSDLHSQQVPQGAADGEYRPGAVSLEMPAVLVGQKEARVLQACAYSARAQAVAEKTRNLVNLEAEDAFLRWQEAARKTARLREGADSAEKLSRDLKEDFKVNPKGRLDEVMAAGILAAELRVLANSAQHDLVLSLAALERVTAGGISVDLGAK